MRNLVIFIFIFFVVSSCRKNDLNSRNCQCHFISADSNSITGKWILTATRTYMIPMGASPWQTVGSAWPPLIEFTADSTFISDNNFPWKSGNYDRYQTYLSFSTPYVIITASIPPAVNAVLYPSLTIQKLNAREIILTRHSIDTGEEEKYVRYCPASKIY